MFNILKAREFRHTDTCVGCRIVEYICIVYLPSVCDLEPIRAVYCSKRRFDLETDLEILWTQTRLEGHILYLGCVYVPTWSDVDTWSELDKSLYLIYNAMNNDCDCVLL